MTTFRDPWKHRSPNVNLLDLRENHIQYCNNESFLNLTVYSFNPSRTTNRQQHQKDSQEYEIKEQNKTYTKTITTKQQ